MEDVRLSDETNHSLDNSSPNEMQAEKDDRETKTMKEQIKVFALMYFGYVAVHLFREFWAMSKKSLKQQA